MRLKSKLVIAGALALSACNQAPERADTEAAKQQILAQEEKWNQAYASRDGDALAGFYADDAAIASPGEQLVRGEEAVRTATSEMASDSNLQLSFRANRVEVSDSGDLGYTRGQYLMTSTNRSTNQPQTTQGYYLMVWEKQEDGSWKVVEDFVTPGRPLPVAERATMVQ